MRHRLTLSIFVYNTEELIHAFYAKECKIHKFYTILCHVSTSSLYCPRTGEFCSPANLVVSQGCTRAVEVGRNACCLGRIWKFCFFFIPGHNCEINTDDCASSPCRNGATCNDGIFAYTCTCATGWTGKNCDTDINECDVHVCQNNATCLNLDGTYNCTCKPGFSDFNCSTDIDECESSPCVNGNCTDLVNGFNCTCFPGYTGNLLKRK